MNDQERREDERLTRLLAAVHADADPVLWTRVRARIEARERQPRWLAWVMRPAALGAAFSLLAVSVAVSLALFATAPRVVTAGATTGIEDLADALVVEADQSATDTATPTPAAAPVPTRAAPDTERAR